MHLVRVSSHSPILCSMRRATLLLSVCIILAQKSGIWSCFLVDLPLLRSIFLYVVDLTALGSI